MDEAISALHSVHSFGPYVQLQQILLMWTKIKATILCVRDFLHLLHTTHL